MPRNESGPLIDQSFGVNKADIHGPWGPDSCTLILLLCRDATQTQVTLSLQSLFESSLQNFEIICIDVISDFLTELTSWTQHDRRISFATEFPLELSKTGAILLVRAGWILGQFSLLALWEALALPNVKVLRSVTEGVPGTLEFWDAEWLAGQSQRAGAEATARNLGLERWISAEGLGMHATGMPAPRVFFRRGAADKHLLDVVVYDAASKKYLVRKENELKGLQREIRELKYIATSQGKRQHTLFEKIVKRVRRRISSSS